MSRLSLKPKILDWYIIKKFISTYLVSLLIVVAIVIIFDISEKIDSFVEREAPLKEIVFEYYLNFIPYILNMFSPLFVFITVIFFTTKLAANSEIIAMLSSGISFRRLLMPYMVSAAFAAILSLTLGMYVIPPANYHRLEFEQKYIKGARFFNTNHNIHYQLEPGLFVYVESFSSWNNSVNRFTLESIEDNKLVSKLTASSASWNEDIGGWTCKNYFIRSYDEHGNETIETGAQKDTVIALTLDDFYRRKNVVETLPIKDLNRLIELQNMRGDHMVDYALIEKHTRIATPFSAARRPGLEHRYRRGPQLLVYPVYEIQPDVCADRHIAAVAGGLAAEYHLCDNSAVRIPDGSKIKYYEKQQHLFQAHPDELSGVRGVGSLPDIYGQFSGPQRFRPADMAFLCHPGIRFHIYACPDGYCGRQVDSRTEGSLFVPGHRRSRNARCRMVCDECRGQHQLWPVLRPLYHKCGVLYAHHRHF